MDTIVCGIGSAGTIMGLAKYFKHQNPNIKIIGVEPALSPFISDGVAGGHKIEGIGAGFYPPLLDRLLIDEIAKVEDDEAIKAEKFF
ncbi:MAG: pyridoxal-phosphate dependent enzyme [Acholeplasmatales bacterium]|nr:pyridoxal-phosphate dependent enzyme [Acholeplasmatales bacterium]